LSTQDRPITADDVRSTLGLPPLKSIEELLDIIVSGDGAKLLHKLIQIEEQGISPVSVAAGLANRLRTAALEGKTDRRQIELLRQLSQVSASARPQESLEITLLSAISDAETTPPAQRPQPPINTTKKKEAKIAPASRPTAPPRQSDFDLSQWKTVLERTKAEAASIYTALRLAEPEFTAGLLTLKFQFPLHQKKIAQLKNQELISRIIKEVCGQEVPIEAVLADKPLSLGVTQPSEPESVNTISNIFGSAEVLGA
ncbi:MAG TPA: hypothetical protein VFK97_03230, partial [Candidatus Saccharimonadales bacterium]|nr:hypothetical protein [Candidatus Saccharimonadales bacterium]